MPGVGSPGGGACFTGGTWLSVWRGGEQVMKPMMADLYGLKQRPERKNKCIHSTSSAMGGHVSKAYVEKYVALSRHLQLAPLLNCLWGQLVVT